VHVNIPDYEIMELPNGDLALTFPLAQALRQHVPRALSWDGQRLILTAIAPVGSQPQHQEVAFLGGDEARMAFAPLPPEGRAVLRGRPRLWLCGLQEGSDPLVFGCEFPLPPYFLEGRAA
jgi:hypothetical protein